MGLLDDAIREHLELKRRRGADPGEVAREEREVLSAELREPEDAEHEAASAQAATDTNGAEQASASGDAESASTGAEHTDTAAEPEDARGAGQPADAPGAGEPDPAKAPDDHVGAALQETAEIDMRGVLETDGDGTASREAAVSGDGDGAARDDGASRAPAPARREPPPSAEASPGPAVFDEPDGGRHGHVPGQESFPFE